MFPGEVFANTADFDTGIRYLLPRYDEMLDAIAIALTCQFAHSLPPTTKTVLELGCGTGELSLKILNRCPDAQLVAVDYSPRMIPFAQKKLHAAGYADRWTGIEADFGDWANHALEVGESFDACVSSLAIHHLTHEMKLKLCQRIRESLNPGGVFWNADPILPEESPAMQEIDQTVREESTLQQRTIQAEIRDKMGKSFPHGYSGEDNLATLTSNLEMLTIAGFGAVAVPWKYFPWEYYGLAVFGGFVE